MRLLTKMSATGLGHDMNSIKKVFNQENAPARFFVGRIFGIANGIKEYVDKNNGEVRYGLKGQFGGISSLKEDAANPIEDARATMCYLPDVAQQDVLGKITEADADGKLVAKRTVEFAFDIYAVAKEGSATGYVFDVDQLITVEENDPLANMFGKIEKTLPVATALAGPSDVAQLANEGTVIDAVTSEGDTPAKGKK